MLRAYRIPHINSILSMQEVQTIPGLIYKYLKDDLTRTERDELMDWVNQSPENLSLFERLTDREMIRNAIREMLDIKESMWEKLVAKAPELQNEPVRRTYTKPKYSVAAVVLVLVLGAAAYFIIRFRDQEPATAGNTPSDTSSQKPIVAVNITPAGHHASLTLPNQSPIVLDGSTRDTISLAAGVPITARQPHTIQYALQAKEQYGRDSAGPLHILSTPRGGLYNIILPDGSTAFLNAASSLRFPPVFTDSVRQVFVTGQVLFNVAAIAPSNGKKIPFLVTILNSNGEEKTTIEVLGTYFDVNAYQDHALLKATLLEGSIRIYDITEKNNRKNKPIVLLPLQQAILDRRGNFTVRKKVDTAAVVSWTKGSEGVFNFYNLPLQEALGEISRWYNVDVLYKTDVSLLSPIASILPRNAPINKIIEVLNLIYRPDILFTLEERTIVVSRP